MLKLKTPKFFRDFLDAMNNEPGGHALKKWISVGFFWLIVIVVLLYTNDSNLEGVLTILAGACTLFSGINSHYKYKNRQLDEKKTSEESENLQEP